ncbi:MAG: peptidyl-prolyl cis-trans isomerase [Puniceicoccales bacterium]|jgi:hypothetical protein|nr:peptidyl-prolyl cis-trans isomerase [Puniceicoccales bacterium]
MSVICALGLSSSDALPSSFSNRLVALVEDQAITSWQLEQNHQAAQATPETETRMAGDPKSLRQHLDEMIDRRLIVRDFEGRKGKIPPSFVEQRYQEHLQNRFHNQRRLLADYLHQHGKSIQELKEEIRQHAIVHFMRQEQIKDPICPSELMDHYRLHPEESYQKAQLQLQEAIMPYRDEAERDSLRPQLASLLKTWQSGNDLAKNCLLWQREMPALQYQNPGWTALDDLRPELQEAVQELGEGENTPWLELPQAFVLLHLSGQQPAHRKALPEVYASLQENLLEQRQQERYERWIQELRVKAFIRYL